MGEAHATLPSIRTYASGDNACLKLAVNEPDSEIPTVKVFHSLIMYHQFLDQITSSTGNALIYVISSSAIYVI